MKQIIILAVLTTQPFLSFTQDSNYQHIFSGTEFPEKIGSFFIGETVTYDEIGLNVGVGYGMTNELELTQYIYPATGGNKNSLVNEHYNSYKNDVIFDYHPEMQIIEERHYSFKGKNGKLGKFKYNGQFHGSERSLISHLYIFEDKGWFIKIRISYPVDNDNPAEKEKLCENEIDTYLKQIPWPTKER